MSINPWIGADFALERIDQIALASIRVRFTQDPLAVDPAGLHDALNIHNYSIVGPSANAITNASTVAGDPQSIDLTFAAPFTLGIWTLNASGALQMASARPLQPPTAMSFTTHYIVDLATVPNGALSDNPSTIIRKHLNPALRGTFWNALIYSISLGDQLNLDNARKAFNQLFKFSASSIYLDRRCADDGISRPANIGMPDDLFRKYAIKLTARKLTQEVLLEILEVFYGSDSVRAYLETGLAEPFSLHDGDDLDLLLDEKYTVKVVFQDSSFGQITQAKALEVAAAITRACTRQGLKAYAVAIVDPSTGQERVRIYSGSLGLSSAVRVTGGWSQPALAFPTALTTITGTVTGADTYNWTASHPSANITRFTMGFVGACKIDISGVHEGDYVLIEAASSGMPTGIYPVASVSYYYSGATLVQTFDVIGDNGFTGTALQTSNSAYRFYRPTRATIQRGDSRTVVISQTRPHELEIVIPATTQAVGRGLLTGAYLHSNLPLTVDTLVRKGNTVTVTTIGSHLLNAGNQIFVDEAVGSGSPAIVAESAGVTRSSLATLWSPLTAQPSTSTIFHSLHLLLSGQILRVGGHTGVANGVTTTELFTIAPTADGPSGEKRYAYTWGAGGSLAVARVWHSAITLSDPVNNGRVVVFGGYNTGDGNLDSIEIYVPATNTWFTSGATLTELKAWTEAIALPSKKVLIMGGVKTGPPATTVATVEVYDQELDNITPLASMSIDRAQFSSIALADGRVLVSGGRQVPAPTTAIVVEGFTGVGTITNTCEIFDENTLTWTRTGSMTYNRYGHRMLLLPDGRVLAVGGNGFVAGQPDVRIMIRDMEIFDPGTGRWSPAGKTNIGRCWPVLKLLPACNKVVVGFGLDSSFLPDSTSEYFDAITMKKQAIPNMFVLSGAAYLLPTSSMVLSSDRLFINGGINIGGSAESGLLVHGYDEFTSGGLNGIFAIDTVLSPTAFTYQTPLFPNYTANGAQVVVTPVKASASTIPGPILFDPTSGPAVTSTESTTTQAIDKGQGYHTLDVADATVFPDTEGWLCLAFGTDDSVFPVRYFGRFSSTALVVDFSFKYPLSIPLGSAITLLSQKAPLVPANPEAVGSFYLTASSAGRVAAVDALNSAVAAGIDINSTVLYPGDRGLGGQGLGVTGVKISDKVAVWAGDNIDAEVAAARGENA